MSSEPLGAIMAGGLSSRYGAPKALAEVGGGRIVDRVMAVLVTVVPDVRLIANDATLADAVGLPWRSDVLAGAGALGGIHAALLWAREIERPGVLAVACDMPFLSPSLLRLLLSVGAGAAPPWTRDADDVVGDGAARIPDVVIPESGGRRGVEPLCAYYGHGCLEAIERTIAAGDRRMIGFHDAVRVLRVPLHEVERHGDPGVIFLNVNTPEDRTRAERLAAERSHA